MPSPAARTSVPDFVFTPFATGFLVLVVGLVGLVFGRPWPFASLGPTAFQLGDYPELKRSRPYNVLAGHYIGLAIGFAALAVMGAWNASKVLSAHDLTSIPVRTSVLAMVFTSAGIIVLRTSHPVAGATTLLISLGSLSTLNSVMTIIVGVAIVAPSVNGCVF